MSLAAPSAAHRVGYNRSVLDAIEPCQPPADLALPPDATLAASVRQLKGFADPTRLRLLWLLRDDEVCVHVLVTALGLTQSAVSHQLRLLRDAHLVVGRKVGRHVYYRLADQHVRAMLQNAVSHGEESA